MTSGQIVTVTMLVHLLQELVEENFVDVLVQGELASISRPASGHYYFNLKDSKTQLRCAMFRSHARALRFKLEEGMEVICRGRVSVYPQRGDLQLIVEGLDPVGVGGLQIAFEQLHQKLAAEGLFDEGRKRPLPEFPATIGVVTSATGAAIHDILTVLRRRSAGVRVILRPVRVQGGGAAEEIGAAIEDLNWDGRSEIVIVGRGGGSKEDLWAFNEEVVARAIAASKIPVISAVGHEIDLSISDLVADLRAATPSAAAELVVRNRLDLERHLDQLVIRLGKQMHSRLQLLQIRLQGLEKRLKSPLEQARYQRIRLQQLEHRLQQAISMALNRRKEFFSVLCGRLDALSPLAVLSRGYAIVRSCKTGGVVRDEQQVVVDEHLEVKLAKGELFVKVESGKPEKK
ncbi:exodeoxyribonuclease VII large subunit [Malonomonas rubra]|uniref:exodeoxyribonuclease VII large subunit n=1 Tax=Malonomonas rubra TaxID=57040 RepID=UPI0026EF89EC|nr:exodeoxyribonuclease VII large subunit [Malonomonas rubra]